MQLPRNTAGNLPVIRMTLAVVSPVLALTYFVPVVLQALVTIAHLVK